VHRPATAGRQTTSDSVDCSIGRGHNGMSGPGMSTSSWSVSTAQVAPCVVSRQLRLISDCLNVRQDVIATIDECVLRPTARISRLAQMPIVHGACVLGEYICDCDFRHEQPAVGQRQVGTRIEALSDCKSINVCGRFHIANIYHYTTGNKEFYNYIGKTKDDSLVFIFRHWRKITLTVILVYVTMQVNCKIYINEIRVHNYIVHSPFTALGYTYSTPKKYYLGLWLSSKIIIIIASHKMR